MNLKIFFIDSFIVLKIILAHFPKSAADTKLLKMLFLLFFNFLFQMIFNQLGAANNISFSKLCTEATNTIKEKVPFDMNNDDNSFTCS